MMALDDHTPFSSIKNGQYFDGDILYDGEIIQLHDPKNIWQGPGFVKGFKLIPKMTVAARKMW
jgi:hypothetical protein